MQKKRIDWLNHSLEFFVVLIGILIAFQLNKCADTNTQNKLVKNHIEFIQTECNENLKRIEEGLEHSSAQLLYVDSLLAEIKGNKNINKIRNHCIKLLDLRNVDLKKDAYRVLVESGDIRYLNDFNKKRSVITLYESFDRVLAVNQNNQKLYDNHFYPYLKENFDLVNWYYVDLKNENDKQKYYSQEFGNTISTYRFLLISKINTYKKLNTKIKEYISDE